MSWAERAAAIERDVLDGYLRRLAGLPGTRIGLAGRPPTLAERISLRWHIWWQAHLLDCLIDAQRRTPRADRQRRITELVTGIRLRNLGRFTNRYYDDTAWLGLALHRAGRPHAVRTTTARLRQGWSADGGGGLWWRCWDDYKNVAANAPAAILFARTGEVERAARIVDWVAEVLLDPATGLLADGVHLGRGGSVRALDRRLFTYCHGTYLGACVELAARRPDEPRWSTRARSTLGALGTRLADASGVLVDAGGGDGGLFAGITGRYLALAALAGASGGLDGAGLDGAGWTVATVASRLVFASAQAWSGSTHRELSVQLTRWMLAEAAARLERHGIQPTNPPG